LASNDSSVPRTNDHRDQSALNDFQRTLFIGTHDNPAPTSNADANYTMNSAKCIFKYNWAIAPIGSSAVDKTHRWEDAEMVDEDILQRINTLVDEENKICQNESKDDGTRLNHIEETLDQCWDLLRQRRALREFGRDPSEAAVRDINTVEKYLQ
jgi:hypothetical protein